MADIAINPVTRRVQFTGNTGTGPFAFTFNILADADIAVYKNTTLLTLTTDYTISTNVNGTGSVTLSGSGNGTALVLSDVLTIIGGRNLERTTDFVTAGDLLASSLNEQLDSLVIMAQQLDEKLGRSVKVNPGDVFTDLELPLKDNRKGTVLGFNATSGDPEPGPNISDVSTLAAITADISTLADIEDGTDATDAIQTVAGISSDVTSVSSNSSNITSVAGNSTNINSVAGNSTNINSVAGSISNVNTVAGSISNVNTVATNIADVNNFTDVYRVAATDPTTSLDEGDLFYDTTLNVLKYYNGTSWVTVAGYSLPTASASTLGGIKVGSGLSISSGVLSADLSGITIEDEGSALTTAASTLNFVGNGVTASGTGAEKTVTITDTNTTYSVGDGGLTENNFTNALKSKLDGIATSATANPNALDNVSEDTSPQLGGNLDVNGNDIVSTSNGAIDLDPDGSGKVTFKGNATRGSGQFVLNCEQNSHGITIKGPAHSAAASYTLTLPDNDGNDGDALKSDGSGNLSFGTPYQLMVENASGSPTLPVINATNTGFSVAIGHQANIGANCTAGLAIQGTLIKDGVTDNASSIAIGAGSTVNGGLTNTAIGPLAQSGTTNTTNDVAFGKSFANGGNSTAINISNNTSTYGATGSSSIAIGNQAKASHTNSVAIGKDSVSSANNRISLGSSSQTVEISAAYRLPSSDGTANQVLQTDGSGTISFATISSGGLSDVVGDTTPQLGGNLDVNGNSIVSVSAGNIAITPDTTGSIVLDGQNWPQADGSANQFLKTNGSGQLSYATVTQATGNELENVVEDTTPQLGGNLDLNSNNITGTGDITPTGDIKPTTYQETVGTESSGTLDLSTGNVFSHAPSTNVTYVFSNPPSTGTAFGFTLKVSPSATITQTWPASVDWAGGTAPTATASGETDVFTFYTQDGGTTYYGFQAGDAMA